MEGYSYNGFQGNRVGRRCERDSSGLGEGPVFNGHSASQEISHLLWNPKIRCVHKSPPLVPVPSHTDVSTVYSNIFTIEDLKSAPKAVWGMDQRTRYVSLWRRCDGLRNRLIVRPASPAVREQNACYRVYRHLLCCLLCRLTRPLLRVYLTFSYSFFLSFLPSISTWNKRQSFGVRCYRNNCINFWPIRM